MTKIHQLLSFIVRGLFLFHWKEALDGQCDPNVAMIREEHEAIIFGKLRAVFGNAPITVQRNLGRGTFVYHGVRSTILKNLSLWQVTLFGGLQVVGDPVAPTRSFTKFSIVTGSEELESLCKSGA